jgi:AhpD family alkylhydroperoxidase
MNTHSTPRMDIQQHAGPQVAAMIRLEQRIELDASLRHLVKVRASMVNGCAFCLDMHWTDARRDGESELRLAQLATWQESPAFDARERAALALCDAMTDVATTHVPDDVYAQAAEAFEAPELAQLIVAIAAINSWNRIAVTTRAVPASFAEQAAAA